MTKQQSIIALILCKAIRHKRVVKFYYKSTTREHQDWRRVEPYLIGKRKQNGNIFLTGWFLPTAGQLKQEQKPGQKQYLLDGINKNELTILPGTFDKLKVDPAKIYNTPTIDVICRVSLS